MADPQTDPIADVLRAVQTSDDVRAQAWDAFHESADADDFAKRVQPLPLPDEVKAALWDAKQKARPQMTFAVVNKQDVPLEDKNDLATLGRHFWEQVNPVAAVKGVAHAMSSPQAMGETLAGIGAAQEVPLTRAKEAYQQGDYGGAAIHALNYLIPLVGPILDEAGLDFRKGQYAAGTGKSLGLGTNMFVLPKVAPPVGRAVGKVVGAAAAKVPGLGTRPLGGAAMTPEQVSYLRSQGVDVTAGMATDNPAVKGSQFLADRSLGGSLVATPAQARQAEAMGQLGGRLATEAHPSPVTPPQAGLGVESSMRGTVETLTGQATSEYSTVRKGQAASTPVKVETHPPGSTAYKQLFQKLKEGVSGRLTRDELYVMRQIEAELDANHYQAGRLVADEPGVASGSHYARGQANAPVYQDIRQAAPGTAEMTGRQMRESIAKTLETGTWTDASRGALEVARKRLQRVGGDVRQVAGPNLGADVSVLGSNAPIQFPTYLQVVKEELQPILERLRFVKQHASAKLMGPLGDALVALETLAAGPDVVPLTVAEDVLGLLKEAARADVKELRTPGEAIFAQAVQKLQTAVDDAARQAGPEIEQALKAGRQTTYEKHGVIKLHEGLREGAGGAEGQPIHKQLTARDDSAVSYLRQVRDVAPAEIPKIGRAYLDEILTRVQGPSDWADKAKGLVADWRKLGPETKQILYGAELTKSLDHFFHAIERIGKSNVNPSGSGPAVLLAGQALALVQNPFGWTGLPTQAVGALVSAGARSALVVDALTQGLMLPKSAPAARVAAAQRQLQQAAKRAGIAWPAISAVPKGAPVPAAAQAEPKQ